ncbi:hypothetical protein Tco_0596862 [Tanacetum coccineum]
MEATRYAKRIPGILQVHATRGERNSQLRSSHCLLLSHPLLIHQAMFLSQILRRIWRRMMMKTLRKILLIILPTEEMMAMIRMSPSDDDEDDDVDIKGDEEEEEHPAPADSTVVALPAVEHAPSAEETEPFKTDESAATLPPHTAYRVTARISIRDEPPTTFWLGKVVEEGLGAYPGTLLMEREARMSREAWGRSMDASDLARSEVMSLRTTVLGQQAVITELQAADRRRQAAITELLAADRRRQAQFIEALKLLKGLQTQMTEFQRQQGPAKGPAQPDAPEEAGVTAALATRDANRSMNGDDNHVSGTSVRRTERVARECTYPDFMKCQPLNFKGTEGVVELIQWFEKMETMFSISNCLMENQIKFSTCTLLARALTWWNSYVRTVGHDVAYAMTWTDLKKKMTDKYCPRVEIKKLEAEL